MQERRQRYSQSLAQQRSITREERSPNVLYTALTIGAVVLLLAVTFAADWLRTPKLSITGAPQFLSPNHDNSYDSATINYSLSEEAEVTGRVLSEGGLVVRTLMNAQKQTAGQHFLVWNGADDSGRAVVDGTYQVEISARGSVCSTSTGAVLVVDTTPPALQLLNLQDGTRVRDETLTVEGITEPGATVMIDGATQPVPVDSAGRFRSEQKLHPGDNKIGVRAIDAAGNTTTLGRTIALVNEAPQVVINSPAEGAWINNPAVTVEGMAPAGVTLKINNQTVPIAPDGNFRFDVMLDEGDQRIQVTATDDVGNVTTVDRMVRVKTRGPSLELGLVDGATFSDSQIQLTGSTTPGSLVLVNQRPVAVGALGDFQTNVQLFQGDNIIQVQARDQAGNTTNLTRHFRYEIPAETNSFDRLLHNLGVLPTVTIPAILLLSLVLGFFLYRQNQLAIELTVDTQTFTPGMPTEGKNLTLRLDLNQPARVTLEVLDQNGEAQATLLDNRRRTARQHVFFWDGYDDFGRPVAAGNYLIKATAGAPPIKVSSAVQVQIDEDPFVYHQSGQFGQIQQAPTSQTQMLARRRVRQNRKRI